MCRSEYSYSRQSSSVAMLGTSYDAAARVSSVSASGTTYASSINYASHGVVAGMRLGNGLWEHTSFNNRLQPLQIGLGTASTNSSVLGLDYSYGTTNNNGNVLSQTISAPGLLVTQSYTYEGLNRLWTATESGAWSQTYSYDQYGNRAVSGYVPNSTLTPTALSQFNPSNNQIFISGGGYDSGGNQTRDAASNAYGYDAENRQASSTVNGVLAIYSYDGDGRRVKKVSGGVTTIYVYNILGQLIAEYDNSGQTQTGGTTYITADHLGSTRVVTDSTGNVRSRHDYLPFGESIFAGTGGRATVMGYATSDLLGPRQRFTSKERDTESALDFFQARYHSSAQGRFTSPDLPLVAQDPSEPQSWNLYSYTANNPLNRIDPDGRNWFNVNGNWEWHEGDTYDPYRPEDRRKPIKSDYTHLLLFQKTGTNRYGAAVGTLTLYDQNRVVATSSVFSGGAPEKGPVPEGTFKLRLDIRDTADPTDIYQRDGRVDIKQVYGIQDIPRVVGNYDVQYEWGSIRARLNELRRGETNPEFLGQYLHGKRRVGDYTHGCICERSERILRILLQMDYRRTPVIPVWVRGR